MEQILELLKDIQARLTKIELDLIEMKGNLDKTRDDHYVDFDADGLREIVQDSIKEILEAADDHTDT